MPDNDTATRRRPLDMGVHRCVTMPPRHLLYSEKGTSSAPGLAVFAIFDSAGMHLGTIATGAQTTNIAWGDDDWSTLYFTTWQT